MDYEYDPLASFGDGSLHDSSVFGLDDYATHFTSINDAAPVHTPATTISPKDLMKETESAPASTALTNLSTPLFDESPQLSSYQTSPLFDDLPVDSGTWSGSLFPDAADYNSQSFGTFNAPQMARNQSSPGQSPGTPHGRHSSISGVNARRRDKPLKEIVVDPSDTTAVKRARNTEAARKSRARKLERLEGMQEEIDALKEQLEREKQEKEYWQTMAQGRTQ